VRLLLLCALLLCAGCSSLGPDAPEPVTWGSADFTSYVAMGTSVSMGIESGGLLDQNQRASAPALIAQQAGANGGTFVQPLVASPGIPPLLHLASLNPLTLDRLPGSPPPGPYVARPADGYDNLAISGALVANAIAQDSGAPYFDLVLQGHGTMLRQTIAQNPTFITIELGANDAILPLVAGGDLSLLISVPAFAEQYAQLLDSLALAAPQAKLALANIPPVTRLPYAAAVPLDVPLPLGPQGANQPFRLHDANGPLPDGSLILLPAILIIVLLVQEANMVVKHLQSGDAERALQRLDISNRMPWIKRIAPNFDPAAISPAHVIVPVIQKAPAWVAQHGAAVIGGIAGVVIGIGLLLLSAFFFYVEGETIVAEAETLSPLPARYNRQFAENFKAVVDATFRGQVITSVTQGIFIGVGLAIAGVPGAILWGAVATVLSLLPIVGSAAVWIPAALWLYITATMGERTYFGVIFLTIWGVIIVPIIEHVIRPWAMKGKMRLPAIPLLVSVLGGMEAFGFVGLVVGPLVFSLLMSIIDIYKRSFRIPDSEGEVA